jgi:hypothetical protein
MESDRRKAGADGRPIRLADGANWLLATPIYSPVASSLTKPDVDRPLNRLIDAITLGEPFALEDIWEVARALLKHNYTVTDDELQFLLTLSNDSPSKSLVCSVLEALFGPADAAKTYTDWVRGSLIANGLRSVDLSTHDLSNVLAILVATNRTVPLHTFADIGVSATQRRALDTLV